MKFLLALFITGFLTFCGQRNHSLTKEVIIEGDVISLQNGYMYLTTSSGWDQPVDSTKIENGHFKFVLKPDSAFVPYSASLVYKNDSSPTKVSVILFVNEFSRSKPPIGFKYPNVGFFFLERGYTYIKEDTSIRSLGRRALFAKIIAGRETELMYKRQSSDFGLAGYSDTIARANKLIWICKEISASPFSFFLLQRLYEARIQYSKKEILELLAIFDEDVQKSSAGKRIRSYLAMRLDDNMAMPNLSLMNDFGTKQAVISANKLNVIIFWASWCGPCRSEIPELKKIFTLVKDYGINFSSVSIDRSSEDWQKALKEENMEWSQFIVSPDEIEAVQDQLNFGAIPFMILSDGSGNIKGRFVGNTHTENLAAVLKSFVIRSKDNTGNNQ